MSRWFGVLLISATALAAETPTSDSPTPLDPVVVTGRKLTIETKIDRKVYSIAEDTQSAFGSAGDVLAVIPSVDVDVSGTVSLRGDTNVLVLIDGKPSTRFQGGSAGDNLQSLSAADIERIEVLTNPPPEYKAEGTAGVINIITRRQRSTGTSTSLQASLGSAGRYLGNANWSVTGARGSLSLMAGYRQDYRDRRVHGDARGVDPSSGEILESRNDFSEFLRRQVPSAGMNATLRWDEKTSINAAANWIKRGGLRTYTQDDAHFDAAGDLIDFRRRLSTGHDPENDTDASVRLTRKLNRDGETLDVTVHRSVTHQHERYDYLNQTLLPTSPLNQTYLEFVEDSGLSEASIDYVLPWRPGRTLKVGYSFERGNYAFANWSGPYDGIAGVSAVDPALSSAFRFRRDIHALYTSLQTAWMGVTWLAGLRAEATDHVATLLTDGTQSTQRYAKIFPSLHGDRPLSDDTTLSVGLSRRIKRPEGGLYDPYISREYAPNLSSGNPALRPQTTEAIEVGLERERQGSTVNLTAYYKRNHDSVTDLVRYLPGGESLVIKDNLARNDASGIEFTWSGRAGSSLGYQFSGNAFYSQIDAAALGAGGLRSTTGVNLKAKLDLKLSGRDSLQAALVRTDRRLTPQGLVRAVEVVNLGFRHSVSSDLNVVVSVNDLFNGQRYSRVTTSPELVQTYDRRLMGRVAYAGVVYALGGSKKERAPVFEDAQAE